MPTDTATAPADPDTQRAWPRERRSAQRQGDRAALVRLRLAEFVAAEHLPADLMQELTAAIDGVIDIVRGAQ